MKTCRSFEGENLFQSKKHHSQLLELLAHECHCQPDEIVNFDLMLADTQPSTVGGLNNEFIYSGRLDNQMSAYCAIQVNRREENDH